MSAQASEKPGRYARKSPGRAAKGGARKGAGRKHVSAQAALERSLSTKVERGGLVEQAALEFIERVGLPPRRRLLMGERVKERTDGPWLRDLMAACCVQTIGRFAGTPLETYPEQQAFLDDALSFNDQGERLYGIALWGIPRKNGKTTTCSGVAIGLASPAEGEGKPLGFLVAGSREQAEPLAEQTADFARGDEGLRRMLVPTKLSIEIPANDGRIRVLAGDGKLNHGRNPYFVLPDELWAWLTPRQVENWAALTTADGARDDAIVMPITTAGYDPNSILGLLLAEARQSPYFEARPEMGGGGFVVRDPEKRLLVHWYAVASGTPMDDLDEWKRANPAPWRTKERIRRDLAKGGIDEGTKRRLYGNEWTSAKDVWIRRETFASGRDEEAAAEAFADGSREAVGVDASLNHDTTAVGEASVLEDGRVAVRVKVWSVRPEVPAHVYFEGPRIELSAVENHIAGSRLEGRELEGSDLASTHDVAAVGFDPRYFVRSAEMLAEEGMQVVEYQPNSQTYFDAVQLFYNLVAQGLIVHDGDPVLAAHLDACAGVKTDRGWKLSKMKATSPIDAVPAVIMAVDLAVNHRKKGFIFIDVGAEERAEREQVPA